MHQKYLPKFLLVLFWLLIAVLFFTVMNGFMRHMNFSDFMSILSGDNVMLALFYILYMPIYTLAYIFIFAVEYPLASVWLCVLIPLHIATGKQEGSIAFFSVKNLLVMNLCFLITLAVIFLLKPDTDMNCWLVMLCTLPSPVFRFAGVISKSSKPDKVARNLIYAGFGLLIIIVLLQIIVDVPPADDLMRLFL